MTPHERAKQVVINYWPGRVTDEHLADGIASAIEAHTADLRTLLAQQAARADALEKSVDRYNELAGRDADRLAELRSALDAETTRRQGLERRIEELLAREARLREALAATCESLKSDFRKWAVDEDRWAAVEYIDTMEPTIADEILSSRDAAQRKAGALWALKELGAIEHGSDGASRLLWKIERGEVRP